MTQVVLSGNPLITQTSSFSLKVQGARTCAWLTVYSRGHSLVGVDCREGVSALCLSVNIQAG